jgi:hypothetical protein
VVIRGDTLIAYKVSDVVYLVITPLSQMGARKILCNLLAWPEMPCHPMLVRIFGWLSLFCLECGGCILSITIRNVVVDIKTLTLWSRDCASHPDV